MKKKSRDWKNKRIPKKLVIIARYPGSSEIMKNNFIALLPGSQKRSEILLHT